MIICEECGARNRNDAYVCAVCEASLLHLEPVPDDEPAPEKRKRPLFGRRKQQQEVFDEPEYAYDAGEDNPEPADMEEDEPEETEPAWRGVFARKEAPDGRQRRKEHPYDAVEDMPEALDEAQDSQAYRDETEEDDGLRFVYEEAADELAPAVESSSGPLEYMAAAAAEESEPETASAADEQTDLSAASDEMPAVRTRWRWRSLGTT